MSVSFPIELEREAIARVEALALRALADRLAHGEDPAELLEVSFRAA